MRAECTSARRAAALVAPLLLVSLAAPPGTAAGQGAEAVSLRVVGGTGSPLNPLAVF